MQGGAAAALFGGILLQPLLDGLQAARPDKAASGTSTTSKRLWRVSLTEQGAEGGPRLLLPQLALHPDECSVVSGIVAICCRRRCW